MFGCYLIRLGQEQIFFFFFLDRITYFDPLCLFNPHFQGSGFVCGTVLLCHQPGAFYLPHVLQLFSLEYLRHLFLKDTNQQTILHSFLSLPLIPVFLKVCMQLNAKTLKFQNPLFLKQTIYKRSPLLPPLLENCSSFYLENVYKVCMCVMYLNK